MHDPSAVLSRLTYELKNPLESILGDGHDLLENAQRRGAVQHHAYLEQLRRSALSTLLLVSNYLDFSRIENGQLCLLKQPIDINALLQRVEHQYAAEAAHRQITFESSLEGGLPMIEADPLALERVFANLVHNGLKLTPASGRVTIHSFRHDNVIAAMVTDAGPGIAAEEVPLLFKKYRRMFAPASTANPANLDRSASPGLGLFVANTLVEAHGGRIEVQSAPEQGSRFTVLLPCLA
jgi:signal transduction histidine kinase